MLKGAKQIMKNNNMLKINEEKNNSDGKKFRT